jgi:hypothetical protein
MFESTISHSIGAKQTSIPMYSQKQHFFLALLLALNINSYLSQRLNPVTIRVKSPCNEYLLMLIQTIQPSGPTYKRGLIRHGASLIFHHKIHHSQCPPAAPPVFPTLLSPIKFATKISFSCGRYTSRWHTGRHRATNPLPPNLCHTRRQSQRQHHRHNPRHVRMETPKHATTC